jgi:hypothetical protein
MKDPLTRPLGLAMAAAGIGTGLLGAAISSAVTVWAVNLLLS